MAIKALKAVGWALGFNTRRERDFKAEFKGDIQAKTQAMQAHRVDIVRCDSAQKLRDANTNSVHV